jgi:hypothetical protein
LEGAMDAIKNGTASLRKASRNCNKPITLLFNHLYGKTRFRIPRPTSVLIIKED